MKVDDFEKMQQNLDKMKNNLETIKKMEPSIEKTKSRKTAKRKNNKVHPRIYKIAKEEQIIVRTTVVIVAITCIFSTTIFANSISENSGQKQESLAQNEQITQNIILEKNENAIELENILLENVSVLKSKEYAEEERPVEFEVVRRENVNLPEGEEVIVQEGAQGIQKVTVIKSYENNVMVAENVLETKVIQEQKPQIIEVGTSKFLAENKVHLGDVLYAMEDVKLMTNTDTHSEEICTILKNLDVTLQELNNDWCKVEYDGLEGYVECKYLTSSTVTPGIVEANRIQKIKMTLSKDMPLNQATELTLEDYKKILSGHWEDKNNVISENAEVFYNVEKAYNINGVFLASIAIHESAWGTSQIASDKKNLFGYGAYDSSPYESSFVFNTYAEGIELVAKVLQKYYLNPEGTIIYNDEIAKGTYYIAPTVASVNVRYASDEKWNEKVFRYMEFLYNKI